MKINPVYKKELKISVRSMRMAWNIVIFNGILALFALLTFYLIFGGVQYGYTSTNNYSSILRLYEVILIIEVGLVLFIIPAFTAGSIAGEREKQTLEILLTTKLKPIQIILGKLEASISSLLLILVSSLPVIAIVFSIGGVRYTDLLQVIFMIFVSAIFVGSIGMFFSTVFKKTIMATVLTYGVILFLTIGTVIGIVMINSILTINDSSISSVGPGIYIWLFNPAINLMSLLFRQYGNADAFSSFISAVSNQHVGANTWFLLSVIVQIVCSILLIVISAKLLNPLKKCEKKF